MALLYESETPFSLRARRFVERNARRQLRAVQGSYLWSISRSQRRFHAFCVGGPKTGTHSFADMFRRQYRADHEPDTGAAVDAILAHSSGNMSASQFANFAVSYDRRVWLEMNSSLLNGFLVDPLVRRLPDAKFILTIRDCYSWADSFMDQKINTVLAHMHPWRRLWRTVLRPPKLEFSDQEALLRDRELFPLDGYFSYWARHNTHVLSTVPSDRLLVLRTTEISNSLERIADFVGVPVNSLNSEKTHSFKAPKRHGTLKQLNPDFVKKTAERYCGELMDRFFPGIKGP